MTADSIGGVWIYTLELCRALDIYGVDIHLAIMGGLPSNHQREQLIELPHVTIYESDFKLEWMSEPWGDMQRAQQWLIDIYTEVKPDLIHMNNYGQTNYEWNCPVITVFHSCVMTWWQSVKNEEAPEAWSQYRDLVQTALNKSDFVVFPTNALKEQAESIYGIIENTLIIYNGRDIETDTDIDKEPFIFSAGRLWDEAKNISTLAAVASELSWPLYIAGETYENQDVEMANVFTLGQLQSDEVLHWMARSMIYVHPAKYEPFGLSILEAASSGCALAIADIDTLREIWGDSAIYFKPDVKSDILRAIESLANNTTFRSEMAAKASQRASEYGRATMAAKYWSLYSSVLTNSKIQLT